MCTFHHLFLPDCFSPFSHFHLFFISFSFATYSSHCLVSMKRPSHNTSFVQIANRKLRCAPVSSAEGRVKPNRFDVFNSARFLCLALVCIIFLATIWTQSNLMSNAFDIIFIYRSVLVTTRPWWKWIESTTTIIIEKKMSIENARLQGIVQKSVCNSYWDDRRTFTRSTNKIQTNFQLKISFFLSLCLSHEYHFINPFLSLFFVIESLTFHCMLRWPPPVFMYL